jgi:hypothetical protein
VNPLPRARLSRGAQIGLWALRIFAIALTAMVVYTFVVQVACARRAGPVRFRSAMALADTFTAIVESLPDDWTDLELDLRIFEERRYVEAAVLLVTCNAQPYSKYDWHWRIICAHRFGHAASVPAVHTALKLLDDDGLVGELAVREVRTGRAEVVQMWGRTESVRREFRTLNSL